MSKSEKTNQDLIKSGSSQKALSRWDGEGGAGPNGPQKNDLKQKKSQKIPSVISRKLKGEETVDPSTPVAMKP
jgi:hypothetical protein